MSKKSYDVIIIGAGAAGSSVAKALAKKDKRVALVERDRLGGTCLNYGCDPTKALLHAAHTHYNMRRAARFGLRAENVHFDWHAVQQRVSGLINNIRGGSHEDALDKQRQRGIDVYLDCATFKSPHELRVGASVLEGAQFVLAMGNTARIPEIRGLRETGFLTHREAIWLNSLPRRLGIIGGGPQGVEFAQMFSRFGVKVTVFQNGPRILPEDDAELAGNLADYLRMEGIQLHCNAPVTRVETTEDGKRIYWEHENQTNTTDVDEILLAAGRMPELDALHLDAAGVEYYEKGVVVDDELRTNVPHIWAAGDITGMYPFTHVASREASVLVHNLTSATLRKMDYHAVPWATFTEPALA
ncbi:MAG: FAD-dependent oxidoreductase, partial [Candidatus Hydrogenedentes bacterium]|nr:FAD-dependent oxidoreductase [Candidatus Hydrogenedentota bacterium]